MVTAIHEAPAAPVTGRRNLLRKALAMKAAAIAGVLALSASGAAAATGNLPDGVQDKVAKAARHVGLNLPHGTPRVTEGCPSGQTFRNRGQYLKWVRENDADGLEAAKRSRCGMPVSSEGAPGADDAGEAPEVESGGKPENPGKSGESHGKSGKHDVAPAEAPPVETPNDGGAGNAGEHPAADHPTAEDAPGLNR